jgi:hypothetical protein
MVALPVIAVCGSLIGNTRTVRLKNKWREPAVFWTCVIADSGTLKSPALDLAIDPLHRLQQRLRTEHAGQLTKYLAGLEQWKARKGKDGSTAGPEPEKPILPRVVCNDTTIERLAELLDENPRGLLLARDELAGWFGSFARYKGKGGGSDLTDWLSMHRANPVTIDRKTTERKSMFIPRAAVSVAGTIQPAILAKAVRGDFLDSGLVARLLLCLPPKVRKRWRDDDLDETTADAYERLLGSLYRLEFATTGKGERVPVALCLDAEARRKWIHFYNVFGGEQHEAEGDRAAALAKLEGYAARLALLHHVIECVGAGQDDRVPIRSESIEAGIRLARWFVREAERVYQTFGESGEQRETRRLTEFIQARGGTVTARELQRANARKYPTAGAADLALDALAGAGLGEWSTSTPDRGGRPSRVFQLAGATATVDPAPMPSTTPAVPSIALPCPVADPLPSGQAAFPTVDECGEFDPLASPWR